MKDKYDLNKKGFYKLSDTSNKYIDKLFEIYRENKKMARIYFLNKGRNTFKQYKTILFFTDKKHFEIVEFEKIVGISKTNKIYSNEKRISKIIVNGNKFHKIKYVKSKGEIRTLKLAHLNSLEWGVFIEAMPWMKFLKKDLEVTSQVTFNKIFSNKLFTEAKLIRHVLGIPYKTYIILHNANKVYNITKDSSYILRQNAGWLAYNIRLIPTYNNTQYSNIKNMDKLHVAMFEREIEAGILFDTIRMGAILDEPVNILWSKKRFYDTHNKWSVYLTNLILELDNYELKPKLIYESFANYSGYKLFTTSKELGLEGKKQSHCVASYSDKVSNGKAGIFHYKNYTIEINETNGGGLKIAQIRGYKNSLPSDELKQEIHQTVEEFNKINSLKVEEVKVFDDVLMDIDDLIF